MNLTEYNAMPEGDLKLAVRLAITMGWPAVEVLPVHRNWKRKVVIVHQEDFSDDGILFDPFTDASIPYGLIGRGVDEIGFLPELDEFWAAKWSSKSFFDKSKTHAILNAYCAADPSGHWAKFFKGE